MPSLVSNFCHFADFRLDAQNRVLKREDEIVPLTPKAFEVLLLLIQGNGQVISKDELMRAVWADSFVEESNLTQTIFMLRKALGETPERRFILTVQGRGYRFVPRVTEVAENAPVQVARAKAPDPPTQKPESPRRQLRLVSAAVAMCLALLLGGLGYLRWGRSKNPPSAGSGRVMLAVLPFQNLTGDANQEYFSDGLTEEMIGELGDLDPQHLGVIARTSVMHYKGSQTPLEEIGRELAVQYVIEGSVRRDSKTVRITAQLIKTKDQTHVWARQYDRELKDLLAVQGEIAGRIADEIELTFGNEKANQVTEPVLSPDGYEAYDAYLKGEYFLNKRSAVDFEEAIRWFEEAARKNPKDARAYAGLADAYALMPGYSSRPQADFIPKSRSAALKALELDPNLADAHNALALIVQNYDFDWQSSEREFRRAIELNPNYSTAHQWYAEHLLWQGRFDEALRESERARQLDPLSLIIAADNGAILFYSRQYDRAIAKWRSVLDMDPDFARAQMIIFAYAEKKMFGEALENVERQRPRLTRPWYWTTWYWATMAYIDGSAGQPARAHRELDQALLSSRNHAVDPELIARAYAGLGDRERSLIWLEKAYTQRSPELVSMKVSPTYDFLRSEPRFQALLQKLGFAN